MQSQIDSILTSTFYDKGYDPSTVMHSYELVYPDGRTENYLDYADWDYRSIVRSISLFTPYKYNGYEKFTTIMYNTYGTTSCYRIVLTFNGFIHPYEIESGSIINLPDAQQLGQILKQQILKKKSAPLKEVVI